MDQAFEAERELALQWHLDHTTSHSALVVDRGTRAVHAIPLDFPAPFGVSDRTWIRLMGRKSIAVLVVAQSRLLATTTIARRRLTESEQYRFAFSFAQHLRAQRDSTSDGKPRWYLVTLYRPGHAMASRHIAEDADLAHKFETDVRSALSQGHTPCVVRRYRGQRSSDKLFKLDA